MKWAGIALLVVVLATAVVLRVLGMDAALWHAWKLNGRAMPETALNLGRYRVDIDARVIEGIADDLSALSYNPERNTLFGILNGEPMLVELSLEGQLLRQVFIEGVVDMEGLSHVSGNRFVIAEERSQRLLILDIPDGVDRVDASQARSLRIGLDDPGNKGFEGVTWDHVSNRLLVVNERDPLRVLAVEGFVDDDLDQRMSLSISDYRQAGGSLPLRDLSSLVLDEQTGHLLLLSDESRMVMEFDAENRPISVLGLWWGMAGLSANVPQAEGMALDSQRRLYIVSEPNLFYRFTPTGD
ncbi:SdiA-regulated domain-containing protein [Pseudomonas sp.]|uniref:SdiA-regulated domain-containing protein n=1 Tax=Pseudomonas sp. TaxID=306 RepID=UPI00272AB1EE|nr:SdiA-regulated domain-containing protein [Pseudomonas sp.]